jgi:hypothetical protein
VADAKRVATPHQVVDPVALAERLPVRQHRVRGRASNPLEERLDNDLTQVVAQYAPGVASLRCASRDHLGRHGVRAQHDREPASRRPSLTSSFSASSATSFGGTSSESAVLEFSQKISDKGLWSSSRQESRPGFVASDKVAPGVTGTRELELPPLQRCNEPSPGIPFRVPGQISQQSSAEGRKGSHTCFAISSTA